MSTTSYPSDDHAVSIDKDDSQVTVTVYGPGVDYTMWAESLPTYCKVHGIPDLSKSQVTFQSDGLTHKAIIPLSASGRSQRLDQVPQLE